ncbi:MAG TPA: 23S rRNA (pseudouridine(1915)-N(3))-methyltransferase RlmH [Chitinophagales bacterium]|nr:23S rRNA (pseudouridine(1915)-N(3))-methyltransferase RlmH [Chitinophagales bacterium]
MKFELWLIGKNEPFISAGLTPFVTRIRRYVPFEIRYFDEPRKGSTPELIKMTESKLILKKLEQKDYLIILDTRGKEYSSEQFAAFITGIMNMGKKKAVFLIGGAYGINEAVYSRANAMLSLSRLTFSHQVVRLVFAEQLYRAFTIINREPYHHA